MSVGPVCDNGKPWQLCKDVCKNASCTRNPFARCISPMGGCGADSCRPKFYDSIGREVQCKEFVVYFLLAFLLIVSLWFRESKTRSASLSQVLTDPFLSARM